MYRSEKGPHHQLLLGINAPLVLDAVDRVSDSHGLIAPDFSDLCAGQLLWKKGKNLAPTACRFYPRVLLRCGTFWRPSQLSPAAPCYRATMHSAKANSNKLC